ncbi:MAG TPA: cyclic nucleotide-binding domain-containing protein [Acidimicrobiales bacterium]|nr:cyclic nucleotide-binding domain-containing protein [Acidimicrobiales bacterium]
MRTPPEGIGMLAQRPLFAGLSRKELESVAALGVTLEIAANEVLTKEGAIGQEAFLIVSGNAHCTVGDEVDVANLGPGDLFGEMSLLDGARRSATVIADTDMTVTVFERREFVRLVETSPIVAMKLLAAMAARLRSADLELQTRRTEEK